MSVAKYSLNHEHCDVCGKEVIQSIYSCEHSRLSLLGYFKKVDGIVRFFLPPKGIEIAKATGIDTTHLDERLI